MDETNRNLANAVTDNNKNKDNVGENENEEIDPDIKPITITGNQSNMTPSMTPNETPNESPNMTPNNINNNRNKTLTKKNNNLANQNNLTLKNKNNNKYNNNKNNNNKNNNNKLSTDTNNNKNENGNENKNNGNKGNNNNETTTNVESQTESETPKTTNINSETRTSINRLVMNLLNHQIVLKLFHFQTEKYGAHKASDAYLEKYANTMDKFLEVAQGIYGKVTLKKYTLSGSSHTDENIVKHLNGIITYMREKIDDVLDEYTELINIRDELVGDAEQLKYLLTFK